MSTEVTIGSKSYYKEDGVWYNEYGEEATRFEVIKIKVVMYLMLSIFIGIIGLIAYSSIDGEYDPATSHNSEDSIFFYYGTPEDVALRKCEGYSFYEYADPNIVMSCNPRKFDAPELRVISEPEMFEVTLATASYYLEQGLLIEGDKNCLAHDFIGEGGEVKYEPSNTCHR